MGYRGTHRTQQHAGKPPAPMAADHHQLSLLRMLEQPPSGLVAHQRSVHADIRILLLPAGEAFSEDLSLSLLALSPDRKSVV